jgi:poly(3-hydroxybutyrate) depolymerase
MARLFTLLLLASSITIPSLAQEPPPDPPLRAEPAPGATTTLTFTTRSDLSSQHEIATRTGRPLPPADMEKVDYNLADESFEVYAPAAYTGDKPFGLLVFVNPHPSGRLPRQYQAAIDKHRLIFVSPNKVGNDRVFRNRMGLAIDAVTNMKTRYRIDPERVYVSGISGGGRISSMLGFCYPDVFRGGVYIIGCNSYRTVQSTEQKIPETGKFGYFFPSFKQPAAPLFKLARTQSRHVLITGDFDGNREQTWLYYQGFVRDKFEHVTYYQVPGMGHQAPDADWFDAALDFLDQPLTAPAATTAGQRPADARAPTPRPTPPARTAAAPATTAPPADRQAVAARLLTAAKLYVDNRDYDHASDKLKWIVTNYPETPAADDARKLLKEIESPH